MHKLYKNEYWKNMWYYKKLQLKRFWKNDIKTNIEKILNSKISLVCVVYDSATQFNGFAAVCGTTVSQHLQQGGSMFHRLECEWTGISKGSCIIIIIIIINADV